MSITFFTVLSNQQHQHDTSTSPQYQCYFSFAKNLTLVYLVFK